MTGYCESLRPFRPRSLGTLYDMIALFYYKYKPTKTCKMQSIQITKPENISVDKPWQVNITKEDLPDDVESITVECPPTDVLPPVLKEVAIEICYHPSSM